MYLCMLTIIDLSIIWEAQYGGGNFSLILLCYNLKYFEHHLELYCKLCFEREGKGIQSYEMLSTPALTAKHVFSLFRCDYKVHHQMASSYIYG